MRGLVALLVCAACSCSKEGPGIPLVGGAAGGPPAPAWDWWKHPSCPEGTKLADKTFANGQRQIGCDRDGREDGPFASIHDGRVHVGTKRDGARVGEWPIYDEQGGLLEVRTYDRDELVYASIVQDGAPLVARAPGACDAPDRAPGGCDEIYGYFPGIARTGVYAPDAGCVDQQWIIDCQKGGVLPPPKDVLARAGWPRAKAAARAQLALRYVEAFSDYVQLPDDAKPIAGADGSVVLDAWVTRTEPSEDPISFREHVVWTFSPAGDVTMATLERKRVTK
ncbi:MAG TPA: hypothetical protein VL463_02530 [Kofleriaceae bacterium]|nr:hypothetical protein [Kofleriaceae bacterium]